MPGAEQIYMFRHALMRDCAYAMQLPSERARLHALLIDVTQTVLGRADKALEPLAAELADHARAARGVKRTGHIDDAFVQHAELRFINMAQRKAMRDHNLAEAVSLAQRAADFEGATQDERAEAMIRVANAHRVAVRYDDAQVAARQALTLAVGTPREGPAQQELSAILLCAGKLDEAETAGNRALEIARASQDQRLEAAALSSQGTLCRLAGRTEEALILLERAAQIAAEVKARDVEGIARIHLGHLLGISGRVTKAREHLAAALRLLEGTERTVNRVDALNYLFDQAFQQGQTMAASKYLQQAETIARELGYRVGLSQTLIFKAMLHDSKGEAEAALGALDAAAAISRELGDDRNLSVALGNIGGMNMDAGKLPEAEAAFRESATIAARVGNAYAEAHAHAGVARVREAQGRLGDAWQTIEHAIALMELAGLPREVLKLQRKLATVQERSGDLAAARRTLMQAASSAVIHGDGQEQQAAQQQLAALGGTKTA